jgi:2-(1,2-epoxy-1,2-dihydrophenyl)acetyl-CoA isomerase
MSENLNTGTDELLCSIDHRVATITLNRPEKRNALSDNLTPALRQTLLELETRNDVGCIVITGAGTAFCAGGRHVGGMGGGNNAQAAEAPRSRTANDGRIEVRTLGAQTGDPDPAPVRPRQTDHRRAARRGCRRRACV